MTAIIPITSLSPFTALPAESSIRAVVALVFPYSSSTRQCALLLSDPDFRLRNRNGQIRVRFSGPSAEAIAKSRIGIGEEVLLELEGASWTEPPVDLIATPGKSVDGELCYSSLLSLEVQGEGVTTASVLVREPEYGRQRRETRDVLSTPRPVKAANTTLAGPDGYPTLDRSGLYDSPAFVKRLRLSGTNIVGATFDPFVEEDVKGGFVSVKKRKIQWRYLERSPSPVADVVDDVTPSGLEEQVANAQEKPIEMDVLVDSSTSSALTMQASASFTAASPSSLNHTGTSPSAMAPPQPLTPANPVTADYILESLPSSIESLGNARLSNIESLKASQDALPTRPSVHDKTSGIYPTVRESAQEIMQMQPSNMQIQDKPSTEQADSRVESVHDVTAGILDHEVNEDTSVEPRNLVLEPLPTTRVADQATRIGERADPAMEKNVVRATPEQDLHIVDSSNIDEAELPATPQHEVLGATEAFEDMDAASIVLTPIDPSNGDRIADVSETSTAVIDTRIQVPRHNISPANVEPKLSAGHTHHVDATLPYDNQQAASEYERLQDSIDAFHQPFTFSELIEPVVLESPASKSSTRSNKQRIMDRTYRSLFGFQGSPSPEKHISNEYDTDALHQDAPSPVLLHTQHDPDDINALHFREPINIPESVVVPDTGLSRAISPEAIVTPWLSMLPTTDQEMIPDTTNEALLPQVDHEVTRAPDASSQTMETPLQYSLNVLTDPTHLIVEQPESELVDDEGPSISEGTDTRFIDPDIGSVLADYKTLQTHQGHDVISYEGMVDLPGHSTLQESYLDQDEMLFESGMAVIATDGKSTHMLFGEERLADPSSRQASPILNVEGSENIASAVEAQLERDQVMDSPSESIPAHTLTEVEMIASDAESIHSQIGELATSSGHQEYLDSRKDPFPRQTEAHDIAVDLSSPSPSPLVHGIDVPLATEPSATENPPVSSLRAGDEPQPPIIDHSSIFLVPEHRPAAPDAVQSSVDLPFATSILTEAQHDASEESSFDVALAVASLASQPNTLSTAPTEIEPSTFHAPESLLAARLATTADTGEFSLDGAPEDAAARDLSTTVSDDYNVAQQTKQPLGAEAVPEPITSSEEGQEARGKAVGSLLPEVQEPVTVSIRRSPRKPHAHANMHDTAGPNEDVGVSSSKTPVRRSLRKPLATPATFNPESDNLTATTPATQASSGFGKSVSSRLAQVPDAISSWFSPRRSTRLLEERKGTQTPSRKGGAVDSEQQDLIDASGITTSHGYFAPLSSIQQVLNPPSQAYSKSALDVLAVVTEGSSAPSRAKKGPRDFFTVLQINDPSQGRKGESTTVEVFRPWHAQLPVAQAGDVVLLRDFAVKSRKQQPYLLSTDSSAWCVWRYEEHGRRDTDVKERPVWAQRTRSSSVSSVREEVKGPPVELGEEERARATALRRWWTSHGSSGNTV